MIIKIELNTAEKCDVQMMSQIGQLVTEVYGADKSTKSEAENPEPEEPQVEETKEEVKEDVKPKRVRKPRAKSVEVASEEPVEPTSVEEPTADEVAVAEETTEEPAPVVEEEESDLPFDEPEHKSALPDVSVKTCSVEQWRKALVEKKTALGVIDGGAHADMHPQLNELIHQISADFGNRIPSKLDDEQRYRFLEVFARIDWDDTKKAFVVLNCPF